MQNDIYIYIYIWLHLGQKNAKKKKFWGHKGCGFGKNQSLLCELRVAVLVKIAALNAHKWF